MLQKSRIQHMLKLLTRLVFKLVFHRHVGLWFADIWKHLKTYTSWILLKLILKKLKKEAKWQNQNQPSWKKNLKIWRIIWGKISVAGLNCTKSHHVMLHLFTCVFNAVIFRTLEAASSKYLEKEAAYIADIRNLEDKLSDVSISFFRNYVSSFNCLSTLISFRQKIEQRPLKRWLSP